MNADNPILNSPYQEPDQHYATDQEGSLNYTVIKEGRRIFSPEIHSIPVRQGAQQTVFDINDFAEEYGQHIINLIRKEVKNWRNEAYPNVTRVTADLLNFWFLNPDRHENKQLFFAQREAMETAIWLNEVAERSNAGQNILNQIREAQKEVSDSPEDQLPRISFKMATGTGKTVVMGALILYHYFNRQEYRSDTRFADFFLLVAPSITIRDRLGVLKVDKRNKQKSARKDYYAERDLVPDRYADLLDGLNNRVEIVNYHAFMPRTLQGNKRSPFDGKIKGYDENGKPIKEVAEEDFNQVIDRVMGNFKKGRRLLVLNDEAHHCYLPRSKGRTKDNEESDENEKAAVWFTGLRELAKRYKLTSVYDLSATPYYLRGSGYEAYSLFGWVVSDFGLIEAIESGLVKIPFLPIEDDTQDLTEAKLKNLYEHVRDDLPKKGKRKQKKDAKKAGKQFSEEPPDLPRLVRVALDQFYQHYVEYDRNNRTKGEEDTTLFSRPPVFIIVCNNTSVSKEVYKFVAGYEYEDEEGVKYVQPGAFDLISNYDDYNQLKKKPPTMLIDSSALDDTDQINQDFKKVFSAEIEEFKRDYANQYGQGAADRITDAEILREVINTVGEPNKMGAHIRCVVSVSMLTEGWDANTVTHVMGIRAFGSQLLCEQVAGRALRRRSYFLQGYDKDGNPTQDKRKIVKYKFPPEYAHIIGVPFKMFKGGQTTVVDPPETEHIFALPDREQDHEIIFPNLIGYRKELPNDTVEFDLSKVEAYEIDGSNDPMETMMETAFTERREKLEVETVLQKRDQEIIYLLLKEMLYYKFSDQEEKRNPKYQYFPVLKELVHEWYYKRLKVLNRDNDPYRRLVYYEDMKGVTDHIYRAINTHENSEEYIRPVFRHNNRWSSTRYVNGQSSKDTYPTKKSHVNKVVMDSDWEGICAKTLEELDEVDSYVKNQFLGFAIPYVKDGKDRNYFPDFIARVKVGEREMVNLIIEITGMNKDKVEKKWYVENRWLPAVNAVRDKYEMDRWAFIEIANDIRDIRNQLVAKIKALGMGQKEMVN